ncbi:4-hydroxyphenylacetate 3-hydroxylase family protein [Sporomusa sp. GT1]|uniref:4-hydroxyphenylacetate 3-hydroxylase family protein n=1 Tax=Sporomusa sp. GT1 TaxID=1534747 RepID=UPI00166E1CA7|nr:4-hydroxyphenylacetate 3-hydroxylase family protein [Sporomusa sp. GT1]
MPLMTPEQYEESLRKLKLKVYLQGELVSNPVDHPIIRPSMNSVKMTYALAQEPQYEDLMLATSHLNGSRINRFTHLHQNSDDLVKKVKMQRLLGQKTASCFQRCVGMDAMNAVDSVTFEMDRKLGTNYHERFIKFLTRVQDKDWTVDGAMTDPKGDRSLSPSKQADPDLFVHIVEKRADGIVVSGAKAHQTGALNSHAILVMPTISMGKEDADYALSFATPVDAEGIYYIYGRQSCDTRKLEGGSIDVGNSQFGGHEVLMVFDNLFVPWENVFMCGEYEFSGLLVERFAGYHRQSYGGCKVGVGDVLIGAVALATEYSGSSRASHVKDKLIEMIHLNETLYGCGIACSAEGCPTASGTYLIDLLLANVCKQNVTRFPYEIARLAEDLAGGLMVTMPSEKDLRHPEIGKVVEKYLKGVANVPTEDRMRILRLIENITLGTAAVGYRTESMHGAGSPQAQRIMISRQGNLEQKKELAKAIACIAGK